MYISDVVSLSVGLTSLWGGSTLFCPLGVTSHWLTTGPSLTDAALRLSAKGPRLSPDTKW